MKCLIRKLVVGFCLGMGLLQIAIAEEGCHIAPDGYEFKVMLKNEQFVSVADGIKAFQKELAAKSSSPKVIFNVDKPKLKERVVSYLDTEQCHLYKNGFILRKRFNLKKGVPESMKVTLKFRGVDSGVVGEKVIVAQPSLALIQSKFEVDVVKGEAPSATAYKYSRSTSVKLGRFKKMSQLMALYPILQELENSGHPKLDKPKEKLKQVNKFTAFESVFEVGSLKIAKDGCDASFSFWYKAPEKLNPIAAEFSYVCEKETDEAKQIFQTILGLDKWLSLNSTTKTKMAYGKHCPKP